MLSSLCLILCIVCRKIEAYYNHGFRRGYAGNWVVSCVNYWMPHPCPHESGVAAPATAWNIICPEPRRGVIDYSVGLAQDFSGDFCHHNHSTMSELTQKAERALADDGFMELDSPEVGESIRDLEQQHFPLASEHGLNFIQHHIFDDNVSDTHNTTSDLYLTNPSVSHLLSIRYSLMGV